MEERSKRLQHLLKRNEEMQVMNSSKANKTRSLPAGAADLFSSYGSIRRERTQTDTCSVPKLDSRRRSLSAGKIMLSPAMRRRFSSIIATDESNGFTQLHNRFASTDILPTSSSTYNFLSLHRMSRDDSDADVESMCSTTDTKYLFTKRISTASIDSNTLSRTQNISPTNQLQSTKHSLSLSDNERYLSDDEAYKRKRFNLASLQYYNAIEPGKCQIGTHNI